MTAPCRTILIALLLANLTFAQDSDQPTMPTAEATPEPTKWMLADGSEHLFWVATDVAEGKFRLTFRLPQTDSNTLWQALESAGQPVALAAHGRDAHLVYHDGTAQAIRFGRPADGRGSAFSPRQLPPLPNDVALVDLAAGRGGPVALVRYGQAEHDRPAGALAVLAHQPTGWQQTLMPDDLATITHAQLVMVHPGQNEWAVITYSPGATDNAGFDVWRQQDDAWQRQSYNQSLPTGVQAVGVQGHITLVQPDRNHSLRATMLRGDRLIELGDIEIPDKPLRWIATAKGSALVVVSMDAEGNLHWAVRDPSASPEQPATSVSLNITPPPNNTDQSAMTLVFALIAMVLILFTTWLRGPGGHHVELPKSQQIARLSPRVIAGLIDLAPGAVVAMFAFSISGPVELFFRYWPGASSGTLSQLLPWAVAMAIYLTHTVISEMLTGRTLGKRLMKCRVVTATGNPPNVWQVIVRNAIKLLELIAYPMFIFVLLSPHKQRLGDVVAMTVVVNDASEDEAEKPNEE